MTCDEATARIRERWAILGIDPAAFPIVFGMDVENMLDGSLERVAARFDERGA